MLPGTLDIIREWFRVYTIPEGMPPNVLGFGGAFLPRAYALSVVYRTHCAWARLVCGNVDDGAAAATSGGDDQTESAPQRVPGVAAHPSQLLGARSKDGPPREPDVATQLGNHGAGNGTVKVEKEREVLRSASNNLSSRAGSRSGSPSAPGPAGSTRRFQIWRNFSLPTMDEVEQVQQSLLQDQTGMHFALAHPRIE
mmetsp:Transcript_59034/g.156674  ORF Transcript_59034/g.156674 Transcript_59034/m.156674 type:complete len:197 (+) Transcript_59034:915-1505(+)